MTRRTLSDLPLELIHEITKEDELSKRDLANLRFIGHATRDFLASIIFKEIKIGFNVTNYKVKFKRAAILRERIQAANKGKYSPSFYRGIRKVILDVSGVIVANGQYDTLYKTKSEELGILLSRLPDLQTIEAEVYTSPCVKYVVNELLDWAIDSDEHHLHMSLRGLSRGRERNFLQAQEGLTSLAISAEYSSPWTKFFFKDFAEAVKNSPRISRLDLDLLFTINSSWPSREPQDWDDSIDTIEGLFGNLDEAHLENLQELSIMFIDGEIRDHTVRKLKALRSFSLTGDERRKLEPGSRSIWQAFESTGIQLTQIATSALVDNGLLSYLSTLKGVITTLELRTQRPAHLWPQWTNPLKRIETAFWEEVLPAISNTLQHLSVDLATTSSYSLIDHGQRTGEEILHVPWCLPMEQGAAKVNLHFKSLQSIKISVIYAGSKIIKGIVEEVKLCPQLKKIDLNVYCTANNKSSVREQIPMIKKDVFKVVVENKGGVWKQPVKLDIHTKNIVEDRLDCKGSFVITNNKKGFCKSWTRA